MTLLERTDRAAHIADYARTRGTSLDLLGAGVVEDADCRDLQWASLSIRGEQSYWRSAGLVVTGRRTTPTFRRCDFSGLRTRGLRAYGRFDECVFGDVSVTLATGTAELDVVGCLFSGEWDGILSARGGRCRVEGNDFRLLRGVDFMDGVDRHANTFDHGGSQLIVRRQDLGAPAVREVAQRNPAFGVLAGSLGVEVGPEWALLHQDAFEEGEWDLLREALV